MLLRNLQGSFWDADSVAPVALSKPGAGVGQGIYTGQEYDASTGLNYFNARYQNPNTGRFISQDQAFLALGDNQQLKAITQQKLVAYLSDPQNLNSYSYARNNPILYNDPTGQLWNPFNSINAPWFVKAGDASNSYASHSPVFNYVTNHEWPGYVAGGVGIAAGGAAGVLYGLGAAGISTIGSSCLAFCGQVANETQTVSTFNSAVSVFKNSDGSWIGQAGNSTGNRIISGNAQEAIAQFNQATSGYTNQVTYNNGQVVVRTLQDGSQVLYRTVSSSGAQATIQVINNQGATVQTLKYMAEGASK
jgi:RHS repeat-associated protein